MILPEIGLDGQKKLFNSKVLIIGAGGIGSPASLYLAGAGIGTIGLVDGDNVEISNMHRQIIHTNDRIGMNKCESAKIQLQQFNPQIKVNTYTYNLTQKNALQIMKEYDIVLDASDNPATRYLVNDASMYLDKPLVSGSSVGWEGQITVYGLNGPCYRCLYPICPKNFTNCNDAGVFGVMPGLIGLIEALETVKILIGQKSLQEKLILIDGLQGNYKSVRIRPKQKGCVSCSKQINIEEYDYATFANVTCALSVPFRGGYEEINWEQYKQLDHNGKLFVDVRPKTQFNILKLEGFINVPYADLEQIEPIIEENPNKEIFIMCRKGNNSRLACEKLKDRAKVFNIIGGIEQYARLYDQNMPFL
ncbi:hypothetical protein pb186bvf_008118 [Paramecium bursaria]